MLTTLTTVQHTSALLFGSFLFVHLAAPATAVVAGEGNATDLATKTMILGRVYYQNIISEPIVVYGAALAHIMSGIAKRALRLYARQQRSASSPKEADGVEPYRLKDAGEANVPKNRSLALPSIHTMTGLLLAPALAVHVALNRLVPAGSTSPINELSPSELDYSFVTYGFEQQRPKIWKYITYAMYALLLGAGSVHVVSGTDRIAQRARARRVSSRTASSNEALKQRSTHTTARQVAMDRDGRRRRDRKSAVTAIVSAAGAIWLAIGIARMAKEGSGVSGYMAKRVSVLCVRATAFSVD
jgi:hypothetical protein